MLSRQDLAFLKAAAWFGVAVGVVVFVKRREIGDTVESALQKAHPRAIAETIGRELTGDEHFNLGAWLYEANPLEWWRRQREAEVTAPEAPARSPGAGAWRGYEGGETASAPRPVYDAETGALVGYEGVIAP